MNVAQKNADGYCKNANKNIIANQQMIMISQIKTELCNKDAYPDKTIPDELFVWKWGLRIMRVMIKDRDLKYSREKKEHLILVTSSPP